MVQVIPHVTHTSFIDSRFPFRFSVATGLPESLGEPLETFVQTITGGSAGGLDVLRGRVSQRTIARPGQDMDLPRRGASGSADQAAG